MSAGDYPTWSELIAELQVRCGIRPEDAASTDPLDIAQAAKDRNPSAYFQALDSIFDRRTNPSSALRYHLLARTNFRSYLTLNIDPLLVDIFDLHGNVIVSDFPNLQVQGDDLPELFCVHGRLGPGRSSAVTQVVLTRREFDDAYNSHTPLYSFIHQTLIANDLCFLGCNPSEPHLAQILEACKRHTEKQHGLISHSRPHWFLLAAEGFEKLEYVETCGIDVVRYDKRDSGFSGLDSVLAYLARKKPPFLRPPGVQESPYRRDVEPER